MKNVMKTAGETVKSLAGFYMAGVTLTLYGIQQIVGTGAHISFAITDTLLTKKDDSNSKNSTDE